jgi:hypothetical protein
MSIRPRIVDRHRHARGGARTRRPITHGMRLTIKGVVSGPKSTWKYLYSLFCNHIVKKTKSLHVLTPGIQKPESERAVPDRATEVARVARSGSARSFLFFF